MFLSHTSGCPLQQHLQGSIQLEKRCHPESDTKAQCQCLDFILWMHKSKEKTFPGSSFWNNISFLSTHHSPVTRNPWKKSIQAHSLPEHRFMDSNITMLQSLPEQPLWCYTCHLNEQMEIKKKKKKVMLVVNCVLSVCLDKMLNFRSSPKVLTIHCIQSANFDFESAQTVQIHYLKMNQAGSLQKFQPYMSYWFWFCITIVSNLLNTFLFKRRKMVKQKAFA